MAQLGAACPEPHQFILFIYLFIYLFIWLHWVFIAVCGLLIVASLVVEHGF